MPACLADGRVPFVRIAVLAPSLPSFPYCRRRGGRRPPRRAPPRHRRKRWHRVAGRRAAERVRASQGLPALRSDDDLNDAADSHSRGIVYLRRVSHDSASGTPCDVRIRRFEKARLVGETIAWLAGTPASEQAQRTVDLWMNSPPHRETL